jgi:peroxin-5
MAHCDGGAAALSMAMQGAAMGHDPTMMLPREEEQQMHAAMAGGGGQWAHEFAQQGPASAQADMAWEAEFQQQQQQQQHMGQQQHEAAMMEQAMQQAAMENAYAEAEQQQQHMHQNQQGDDGGMLQEFQQQEQQQQQPVLDEAWQEAEAQHATGEDYIEEMLRAGEGRTGDGETWAEEFHDDFAGEYLNGDGDMAGAEDWLNEYKEMNDKIERAQHSTDYPFEPNNAFLFRDAPFEEGVELLAGGMLSDAVLAFEAACQKDGENVEAWLKLGTTQAENEKDSMAILALNKCRHLCPGHLNAHMALAVSHTNEANHTSALSALRSWILANDRFPGLVEAVAAHVPQGLVDGDEADQFTNEYLFSSATESHEVAALFGAAAEMDGANAEVHVGLGILHNLSRNYDLAADNFTNALKLRPDDEKLWNKLGATLANGNRSDEAIGAYNKALDLKPGFVRAQYNLGIAFSNLTDHRMAATHFLRAIVMQQGGVVVEGDGAQSEAAMRSTRDMWDVLRMTFNLMERPDLVEVAWKQSVAPFLPEFGLQDLIM